MDMGPPDRDKMLMEDSQPARRLRLSCSATKPYDRAAIRRSIKERGTRAVSKLIDRKQPPGFDRKSYKQ
jgi:hypothetical protein